MTTTDAAISAASTPPRPPNGKGPVALSQMILQARETLLQGRNEHAVALLRNILSRDATIADAWFLLGAAAQAADDPQEALGCFQRSAQLSPDWAEAWFQTGVTLAQVDRFAESAAALQRATELKPDWIEAWLNLGSALSRNGESETALVAWRKVLRLSPEHAQAHYNCGHLYQTQGHWQQAAEAYIRVLNNAPDMVSAHINLGTCHLSMGDPSAALACFKQAVRLRPDYALAHINLAGALAALDRFEAAVEAYTVAIRLAPSDAAPHFQIAALLRRRWRLDEAISHCRQALALAPQLYEATVALYEMARHGCLWDLADRTSQDLDRITDQQLKARKRTAESPLISLWRHADPARNLAVARSWSLDIAGPKGATWPGRTPFAHKTQDRGGPIRIGYLSGDFKAHAVAHQIRGLLRAHDRRRFQIFGYAANPSDQSEYREELAQACDRFTAIDTQDDRAAAEVIYRDGIDILVDLSGHTEGGRLDILALRPAPIQAGYLGFLGSSGADFIDYFISDAIVTPASDDPWFSEKLIRLPGCYQVNDDAMVIAEAPVDRVSEGLPPDAVVLCCFNQPFKIDDATLKSWLTILQQAPQAVLWLMDHNVTARRNLCQAAGDAGVDPGRLIFSKPTRIDLHLRRLQLADLALDTFGYNGGATTANALWAGVPLVTLPGRHMVSRMSASALQAVGLPELVTRTPEAYGALVRDLVFDAARLADIRSKLARNRFTTPLFNTRRFARHLESAFETMMDRYLRGAPPKSFSVHPGEDRQTELHQLAQTAQQYIDAGDLEPAAQTYRQMLALAPEHPDLHYLLGLTHFERQQWDAAEREFKAAIALDEGQAIYWHCLGDALRARKALPEACRAYEHALTLAPDGHDTLINLGNAYYEESRIETARSCYERALKTDSRSAKAMNNIGKSYYDLRDVDQAMRWYHRALTIDPDYAEARFNHAAALLLTGDYHQGWQAYEWRFKRRQAVKAYPHRLPGPRWKGEPYEAARLLVHCEQGLGDVIQFARFLPQAKSLGGTLLLEVQAPLIPLFKDMPYVDRLTLFSAEHPAALSYDLHTPLLSLPRLFGTSVTSIPNQFPYIHADPAKSDHWRRRLAGCIRRIGLVWSCSDETSYRESRLECMYPLLEIPGIHWYSLQKGSGADQLADLPRHLNVTPLGDDLQDFGDTAAVLAHLDLLISVDTAIVHVAGAMGLPVWVLLPFAGDWRWLRHPTHTPWYPSARLFRQARPFDWQSVINQVMAQLPAWVAQNIKNG